MAALGAAAGQASADRVVAQRPYGRKFPFMPWVPVAAQRALWPSSAGLVMLMGLVTKNAILLVDFANHARKAGATVADRD